MDEARKYQVLPLDNSILERALAPRPSATAGRTEFTYSGEMSGLPDGNAPNLSASPTPSLLTWKFRRRVPRECSTPLEAVSAAMVFTCSRANRSSPTTCSLWNASAGKAPQALTPGKHTIVFDFKYDGPGMAKGGTGVLSVDGKEVAKKTIPHTVPAHLYRLMSPSTSEWIPAQAWMTTTTSRRSGSPASSTS